MFPLDKLAISVNSVLASGSRCFLEQAAKLFLFILSIVEHRNAKVYLIPVLFNLGTRSLLGSLLPKVNHIPYPTKQLLRSGLHLYPQGEEALEGSVSEVANPSLGGLGVGCRSACAK